MSLPLLLCSSALLPSCNTLFHDDYLAIDTPMERLREIDAVSLADHSQQPPVSVEEAAEEVVRQVLERPEPPATLDLAIEALRSDALANNLDLEVEFINPAIADTSVDEERARFEAVIFGSARRNVIDSPVVFGTQGSASEIDSYDLGVRIPLRTGGEVTVDFPLSRQETNNPFSLLNPAYDTDLRFSISQPLLRNAGTRANTHAIRVARYQSQISNALTKLAAIRILAEADRVYWRLYAARRELEVRQQQYELAMAQLEQARRKVDAGDVAEIEIIRAESGVASRLEAIIVAETEQRRRQRDLKRVMNRDDLPMSSATAIIPVTPPDPVGLDLDPVDLADFAIDNRMDMLEQELQLAIEWSTERLERNRALPLVTLDYTYNINGLGTTAGGALDQIPPGTFTDWNVGLTAEVPLGNEAAEARVDRAVLRRLQRLATRRQRELAIRQEVHDAVDQLDQNWQRILAARQEVILAGRTLDAEQRQFDQGLRTSTDVLDAATNLADAQSREIQALTDYQISQIDIAFATGTLLGSTRVHWQPGP